MAWSGLGLPRFAYQRGLCDLGRGLYAWLQPDGSWGWSNAGLVADGGEALLVDTLFDLRLTAEMLSAMRAAEPAAARIGTVVNTHANGDHTHGNQLLPEARIVASKACAEEMAELPPARLHALQQAFAAQDTPTARFVRRAFGRFDFSGIEARLPDATFAGSLVLQVGAKRLECLEVGPAHTRGDVIVHVPGDRVVFSGDILFVEGTPILWSGPVGNWIAACRRILALEPEVVVPGHGPLTDGRGVEAVRAYLEYVRDQARRRYDAGLSAFEAARDIALGDFSAWGDAERIVVNVDTLYREFSGSREPPDLPKLLERMALLAGD
jgi:glyoxylase-like metal-dependent hydrolase (beta-lactamase superfamily II)